MFANYEYFVNKRCFPLPASKDFIGPRVIVLAVNFDDLYLIFNLDAKRRKKRLAPRKNPCACLQEERSRPE